MTPQLIRSEAMKHVLLLGLALSFASPAFAQSAGTEAIAQEGSTAPAEAVSTSEDESNRMTVPVMVNGKGPFHFVIDTGSDRSVIAKEVADQLNLPNTKTARLISMSGVNEVKLVKVDSLRVTPLREMRNIEVPGLLRKNIGADGILGLDALKGQRIHIDFAAQNILIEPGVRRAAKEEPGSRDVIIVRGKNRLGQLVLVDADANGEEIWVVVDTGGQNSVANSAFRRLMAKGAGVDSIKRVELLSVVGGRVPAEYSIVGKMRVGGVRMSNAAVAFADAHPFKRFGLTRRPAMLMGVDALRSFRKVSIDFANREVRFHMPAGTPVGMAGTP
jgi:predicted aspartyl protease